MKVFETFGNPEDQIQRLLIEAPTAFNGLVRVERYRVTVERIEEPEEVIKESHMKLVTLESVNEALEHLEQHNGPGRLREAQTMLKKAEPLGWIANSPADLEPVEAFTRIKTQAEQYRAAGWLVTEVFASASASQS